MLIHEWTVNICYQVLNTTPSGKDDPYVYAVKEPDVSLLTMDELDHITKMAEKIIERMRQEKVNRIIF